MKREGKEGKERKERKERKKQRRERKRGAMRLREFLMEEDGVGVIEVVLILVVLIGLVIVFKKQINTLLSNIFTEINKQSKEVY